MRFSETRISDNNMTHMVLLEVWFLHLTLVGELLSQETQWVAWEVRVASVEILTPRSFSGLKLPILCKLLH